MRLHVLLILLIVLAGCAMQTSVQQTPSAQPQPQTVAVPEQPPGSTGQPATQAQGPATAEVKLSGFKFVPASLAIKKGTTVVWTNMDSSQHTVTFDSLAIDENLAQGAQFSHTFDATGTFDYGCRIHPSMRGTVVVE